MEGLHLEFASEALRDDYQVVAEAVEANPRAIAFASPALRGNKDIARLAVDEEERTGGLPASSFASHDRGLKY